jgi:hypothetical protein
MHYILGELFSSFDAIDKEPNIFVQEGLLEYNYRVCEVKQVLLDTGASHGNYIGRNVLSRIGVDERPGKVLRRCDHRVRLGDGKTIANIRWQVTLNISLRDPVDASKMHRATEVFFISEDLGDMVILGRPAILNAFAEYFIRLISNTNAYNTLHTKSTVGLGVITPSWDDVFVAPNDGELAQPWTLAVEMCPEEDDTPHPYSFSEDTFAFMEMSVEDSRKEYLGLIASHVSNEMQELCPAVLELLTSDLAMDVFAPAEWKGIQIEPITMRVKDDMQLLVGQKVKARPIRPDRYEKAKQEYDRICQYMYVPSDSPIASPLVVADKGKEDVRLCGDYRKINEHIEFVSRPIPQPILEFTKAAHFQVFNDLDMANSFHQIPLSKELSDILSIQTPWGLVRPLFLPEGVSPASGILQMIVQSIFSDYADWMIVIFDNFLILAHTVDDAYAKLLKVLQRCKDRGIVLKFKKSWLGMRKVTFFGFEVSAGKWGMSADRKRAISEITFPKNTKEMQSFLGMALFFHHHIPHYTEWTAILYEMTHSAFNWDPNTWKHDYKQQFRIFIEALQRAMELHLPDYSKPWRVRSDSSDYGIGGVLFQIEVAEDGTEIYQPIDFTSKRYSKPALNWDTYKKEAYAIYYTVHAFAYYLRGKSFIMETDHRNLQWIEQSQVPIIVRWRNLLQSFDFVVRHIAGKQNIVADFLSRMRPEDIPGLAMLMPIDSSSAISFEQIMTTVHGGRNLHYGAYESWRRAKQHFPNAEVTLKAVREYVRECPMCQKSRDVGVRGLKASTLSLKKGEYRLAIGVDHVTVTPADRNGNTCVILLVEHFAHFPQAYPAKTYDAPTLAKTLFKHFCTFGLFHQLVSDPGSAMMSEVVRQLNQWVGVRHKVSLVGRHESNGVEGSAKQFIRHLSTLVHDERIVDQWGDDTVLPLINFAMASFPTSETGGYTPFELKYGTEDARYFRLPEVSPDKAAGELVQQLNANLKVIRERSRMLQQAIVEERAAKDGPPQTYAVGDLLLWDPLEHPHDHLPTKLTPRYAGPYRVLSQLKNDIQCKHVVTDEVKYFHCSRVHPFLGTDEQAYEVGKLDKDQYLILSIQGFVGNPNVRRSLQFYVEFERVGVTPVPYTPDLATSTQFHSYIHARSILIPLRYTVAEFKREKSRRNRLAINDTYLNTEGYIHLRYWDEDDKEWYDTLNVPDNHKEFYVPLRFNNFQNSRGTKLNAYCPIFNRHLVLKPVDLWIYCVLEHELDNTISVVVTEDMEDLYIRLLHYADI